MKNIEITTAQNIVFQYELASLFSRIAAFIMDGVIIGIYVAIVSSMFGSIPILNYVMIGMVVLLYHFICEVYLDGQSIGKRLLKIRVITINGAIPSVNDYFMRWIFRMVDITLSLGGVAILSIISSDRNQRIGDVLAKTIVVNLRASRMVSLENLLELDNQEVVINYPQLADFSDEDMLLLKQCLSRYQQNKNEANKAILKELGSNIAAKLELSNNSQITVEFLKNILKEYIILTRA